VKKYEAAQKAGEVQKIGGKRKGIIIPDEDSDLPSTAELGNDPRGLCHGNGSASQFAG
jgi:hypothetical protein